MKWLRAVWLLRTDAAWIWKARSCCCSCMCEFCSISEESPR
jgi:hypothetical protein